MAVTVLPPRQSLSTAVQMAATTPGHGGHSIGPSISAMPLTIVAPPSVLRCSSASTSRRGSSASSNLGGGKVNSTYHQPRPPPHPNRAVEPQSKDEGLSPSGAPDPTPLRLPKLESLPPQSSSPNAKASSSDSILTRTSNKVDSEISSQTKLGSSVKDGPRGSAFPNFRILQRLATSARLRSAKKNALNHLNAKRTAEKRTIIEKQDNSDLSDASEKLQSVTIQATGLHKAFDKVDHDSGLSSLESPTIDDAKDEDHGVFYHDVGCNEYTTSTSPKKGKRARKKRPVSVKMRFKRRSSARRSKSKSTTPITASSIGSTMGSVTVPGLGPLSMMVEPTKVEIYSSRYNTRKQTTDDDKKPAKSNGVPQGSRSWSKNNTGERKSLEASTLVTLRSLTQASTTYGSSSTQVQALPGHNRRRMPIENKIRKVFLSEKQSSSIRDCGLMMPCAPPATPMPETLQNVEYVPCMSDLRSQRAIKTLLTTMEKEAKEKRQKRIEEAKKLERQLQRNHVALKKYRQRQEIYALNKVMTELEHKHFHEFCEQMKNVTEKTNVTEKNNVTGKKNVTEKDDKDKIS